MRSPRSEANIKCCFQLLCCIQGVFKFQMHSPIRMQNIFVEIVKSIFVQIIKCIFVQIVMQSEMWVLSAGLVLVSIHLKLC